MFGVATRKQHKIPSFYLRVAAFVRSRFVWWVSDTKFLRELLNEEKTNGHRPYRPDYKVIDKEISRILEQERFYARFPKWLRWFSYMGRPSRTVQKFAISHMHNEALKAELNK